MIRIKIILALIITLFWTAYSYSQQNNTLFLMHQLPQANIVNPAIPIECKLFVGLPGIGSTHINAYSTGFSVNDVLVPHTGDSLRFDPDRAISNFRKNEIVAAEAHLSLISVGFKYKRNYFTFGINEKANVYTILNKNTLMLINGGNTQFEGRNVRMHGTRVNAMHYREYALGWAREIDEKWSLGFRFKMLYGKANFYSKPIKIDLYTDQNTFDTYVSGSGVFYSSLPIEYLADTDRRIEGTENIETTPRDYIMNKSNRGFAVDLGFIYKFNEYTTLSGSALDIGSISWKTNSARLSSIGSVDITGTAIEEGLGNASEIADSLENVFTPRVYNVEYISPLVPRIYVGLSQYITSWFDFGTVINTELYKNRVRSTMSFVGNLYMLDNVYTSLSYTVQNKEFNNIGVGLGARFGVWHFHAITDNLTGMFNLTNTRNVNLRFGFGLFFGCGRKIKIKKKKIKAIPCIGDPYNAVKKRLR